MSAFASLSIAASAVASLNLCSDEYLLLLAKPAEIASVTRLAHDPLESPMWKAARRYPPNRGDLEGIVALKPRTILTMDGGGGRSTALLARRMGMRIVSLPSPSGIEDVIANLRRTATMLGDPGRADPWISRIAHLRAAAPRNGIDALFVSGGGVSLSRGSPAIEWLRLAGYAPRPLTNGRVDLETLLVHPPSILVKSRYRSAQVSAGQRWLDHPLIRRIPYVETDGRPWTCAGPLMVMEVERLQRLGR